MEVKVQLVRQIGGRSTLFTADIRTKKNTHINSWTDRWTSTGWADIRIDKQHTPVNSTLEDTLLL